MKKHPEFPFAPSGFPFYYGWIILAVGTLGVIMSLPGQTIGVSIFTESLLSDLDINRNNLSLAYLIGTIGSGLLITGAGKIYDRRGARTMALISSAMLGLVLLYLTRVEAIVGIINRNSRISLALATFIVLTLGFWGIRFFGQGLLTMVSRNMVMKWFNRRRGMANAVLGIFSAFGFALAPRIFALIIEKLDWQGTWLLLAVIVGIGFFIIVFFLYRDNPTDCGLKADGSSDKKKQSKRPPSLPPRDYTLGEARNTLAFWGFTLGITLAALYISGLIFHVESVFKAAGLSREMALGIFLPTSIIAMVVQFVCGYLSDFIRLKYLLLFFMAGMLLTSLGLVFLDRGGPAYWSVITGNGIVWGLFTVLIAVTWPRFFGLKNLGAISGFSLSLSVIGSAIGPYMYSLSFSVTGHYGMVAWICVALSVILFFFGFKADNPND